MVDIHIEFAHIYNDKPFCAEQKQSAEILKKVTAKCQSDQTSYILSILVDDQHAANKNRNIESLLAETNKLGARPDLVAFESSFAEAAEQVIDLLPDENKRIERFRNQDKEVLFYFAKRKKIALKDMRGINAEYKCAVLSCAWLLCKLGVFAYPADSYIAASGIDDLSAKKILAILPEKYRDIENTVLDLLCAIGMQSELSRIEYLFF